MFVVRMEVFQPLMGVSNTHHLFTFEFAADFLTPFFGVRACDDEKKVSKNTLRAKLVADTPLLILDTYTS